MADRLQGWTFFDIGKALGVTPGRAHQLVDEALEATLQGPAAHLRVLALARLDALMTGVFGKAVNGDTKALTIVLKIIDRQAKLLGLYEPPVYPVDHHFSIEFVEPRPLIEGAKEPASIFRRCSRAGTHPGEPPPVTPMVAIHSPPASRAPSSWPLMPWARSQSPSGPRTRLTILHLNCFCSSAAGGLFIRRDTAPHWRFSATRRSFSSATSLSAVADRVASEVAAFCACGGVADGERGDIGNIARKGVGKVHEVVALRRPGVCADGAG